MGDPVESVCYRSLIRCKMARWMAKGRCEPMSCIVNGRIVSYYLLPTVQILPFKFRSNLQETSVSLNPYGDL